MSDITKRRIDSLELPQEVTEEIYALVEDLELEDWL